MLPIIAGLAGIVGINAADCNIHQKYEQNKASMSFGDKVASHFEMAVNGWKNILTGTTPKGSSWVDCGYYRCDAGDNNAENIE